MLRLFLFGPWQFKALVAAACFALAWYMPHLAAEREAEKAEARAAGLPAEVALDAFDPARDVHAASEVHVVGWINADHNYRLVQERRRNFVKTGETVRRMLVLFGPGDAADSRAVRAILLMDEGRFEDFVSAVPGMAQGFGEQGIMLRINGAREKSPTLRDMAEEALAERGLVKAPNFVFIDPWLPGTRDAWLAPRAKGASGEVSVLLGLGGLFTLLALLGLRRRPAAGAAAPAPAAAVPHRGAAADAVAPAAHPAAPAPAGPAARPRRGRARLAMLGVAGVVAVAAAGGPAMMVKLASLLGMVLPLVVVAAVMGFVLRRPLRELAASLRPKPEPAEKVNGPIRSTAAGAAAGRSGMPRVVQIGLAVAIVAAGPVLFGDLGRPGMLGSDVQPGSGQPAPVAIASDSGAPVAAADNAAEGAAEVAAAPVEAVRRAAAGEGADAAGSVAQGTGATLPASDGAGATAADGPWLRGPVLSAAGLALLVLLAGVLLARRRAVPPRIAGPDPWEKFAVQARAMR